MARQRKTSSEIASLAGKKLANPKTPEYAKKLAGTALSQAAPKPKTRKRK